MKPNLETQIELLNLRKLELERRIKENSKKELNSFIAGETNKAVRRTKEQFIISSIIFTFIVSLIYIVINQ
jgi:hypothetical protein